MNMSSRDPSKKWQGALPEPAGTGCQACLEGVCSVHRAGTAYRTTHFGTVKRFVDDLANGAGTPAALLAALRTSWSLNTLQEQTIIGHLLGYSLTAVPR